MLTKLGDKIYYIAIHILENGLSPKPFYVMPSKKSNKKFLVKEGNRRTTALKLMANPKLIDSKKHASLKNRFFKLHERFMETPIRKIMCYIYDDVEEADKWVRLEHTGEQNGVGIVEWKPEQVQRFDIKHGKNKSVEIQAIDFIRTSPFVQEEVKRASENISIIIVFQILTIYSKYIIIVTKNKIDSTYRFIIMSGNHLDPFTYQLIRKKRRIVCFSFSIKQNFFH